MAYSLSMAVVSPALPLIQEGLGTSAAGAAWALTAMTLSAAVATPLAGGLGDLFGPRRVLLGVLAVATAGMVVAASAASLPVMLVGRALAGVGGGVFPLAYTIIRETVPPARTSAAVGLMSSMLGVGGAVSWCVAGPVIDHLGWRWLLWLPVCGLVPGWFAAWWIVPEGRRRPRGGSTGGARCCWRPGWRRGWPRRPWARTCSPSRRCWRACGWRWRRGRTSRWSTCG
ncbi:MFS transporter [Actinomadura keratinilytica]|uniref:MFS transporter n=1 Tax=Actinomadura keratinilytica TaxID=547461 RepID=UPI00361FC884